MENLQKHRDDNNSNIEQLNHTVVDSWPSGTIDENNSTLHYIAIKMDNACESKDGTAQMEQVNTQNIENWQGTGGSDNNSTLLYIAVEYVKNGKSDDIDTSTVSQPIPQETYTDFTTPHVSPLDPNMSSVARYSPVSVQYQENCSNDLGPIIIHHYVGQDNTEDSFNVNQITAESALENLPANLPTTILCNSDLQPDQSQYLQMINNTNVNDICETEQLMNENDQQEVELLITDHATGRCISYSVNAQELLVEKCLADSQQLLESIAPSPILQPELFSYDDGAIRSELNTHAVDSSLITSVNEEVIENYIDCLTNRNISCSSEAKVHTRTTCNNKFDDEENLLSCVYSVTDKPILSRARASLPESYLSISNIDGENAVIAKKRIPKRTQFGPLKGVLDTCKKESPQSNRFLMLVDENIYCVDISDENSSNWMSFVRQALTFEEQNLIITQEGNGLYFTATRHILPKEELKVGYSSAYAKQFNLQVLEKTEKKTWPCFECSEKFCTSDELQKHFSVHDQGRDENTKPKRKFKKSRKINKTHSNILECNVCHEIFHPYVSCETLKTHLLEKHKYTNAKTAEHFTVCRCFQCTTCEIRFKLEVLLNIHSLEHDSELPLDHPNHLCPQCQRKFPTRKQLVLHISSHALPKEITKDDSVKCKICHKYFSHSNRLQKHMLCHGSDEFKPLQCTVCKKRFLTKSALEFHTKIHMTGGKLFQCPICKEHFDHVLKLRLHVPNHAQNNVYTCPQCKKAFGKYNILRKHMKFHSERQHRCENCTKAFNTKENLKKHMLRHSDHKEFLCADCGKLLKRKDKLAEHIKRFHLTDACPSKKGKSANAASDSSRLSKEPTDFHRFIYKCHSCLIGFKRRGMLVNHLAKRHPDIRPDSVPELNLPILQTNREYYCQYCDKVYKSSAKRKLHIFKNHPGAALPAKNGEKYSTLCVPPSSLLTSTTRPNKCQWCHKQYARKGKLLQHIRSAHPSRIVENESKRKKTDGNSASIKTSLSEPLKPNLKEIEVTNFMVNHQTDHYADVLNKSHQTTDGNMTEITPAVIDGLMDEDSKYCHLSIDENEMIESGQLENPNTHLYHLLSSNSGMMPPR